MAGEGEAGDKGDADPGSDEGAHEAVVAGAAGDTEMEAADGGEHVQDAADLAPPVHPAFAGELGQTDRRPAGERVASGNQQPEVVSGEHGVAARPGGSRPRRADRDHIPLTDMTRLSATALQVDVRGTWQRPRTLPSWNLRQER